MKQIGSSTAWTGPSMPWAGFLPNLVSSGLTGWIWEVIDASLREGVAPVFLKKAMVCLYLKRLSLNPAKLDNWCSVSNSSFLGKVLWIEYTQTTVRVLAWIWKQHWLFLQMTSDRIWKDGVQFSCNLSVLQYSQSQYPSELPAKFGSYRQCFTVALSLSKRLFFSILVGEEYWSPWLLQNGVR